MNNILNKLYYGEINPAEKPAPATKRYIENRELICSTENKLLEQFPDCKEVDYICSFIENSKRGIIR
jgi:hypothetical protein